MHMENITRVIQGPFWVSFQYGTQVNDAESLVFRLICIYFLELYVISTIMLSMYPLFRLYTLRIV